MLIALSNNTLRHLTELIMDNKIIRIIVNGIRFIGKPFYIKVLAVDTTTIIRKTSSAKVKIGNGFRSRRNVEINARDNGTISIGDNVFLNSSCIITARNNIEIGDNTIFGPGVVVYDNDHIIRDGLVVDNEFITAPITIGRNVWIGANTVILKGSQIEDGTIIAAGCVVKGNVPSGTILIQKRETTYKPVLGNMGDYQNEN